MMRVVETQDRTGRMPALVATPDEQELKPHVQAAKPASTKAPTSSGEWGIQMPL